MPRKCDQPPVPGQVACPIDPYVLVPDKCKYVDQQTWKLQAHLLFHIILNEHLRQGAEECIRL